MKRLLRLLQWLLKAAVFYTVCLRAEQSARNACELLFQHLLVCTHGAGGPFSFHARRGRGRVGHGATLVARAPSRQTQQPSRCGCRSQHKGDPWSLI